MSDCGGFPQYTPDRIASRIGTEVVARMLTDVMSNATSDDMAKRNLQERLAALLHEAQMSPAELARRSKVGKSTISKLLRGEQRNLSWATAIKLASGLGCDPRELAGGDTSDHAAPVRVAGEAPRYRASEDEPQIADVAELLRLYMASDWIVRDKPTPEEMQWLAGIKVFTYTGKPPTAGTVSILLRNYRAGKVK